MLKRTSIVLVALIVMSFITSCKTDDSSQQSSQQIDVQPFTYVENETNSMHMVSKTSGSVIKNKKVALQYANLILTESYDLEINKF